jgi:hypothetical protein
MHHRQLGGPTVACMTTPSTPAADPRPRLSAQGFNIAAILACLNRSQELAQLVDALYRFSGDQADYIRK